LNKVGNQTVDGSVTGTTNVILYLSLYRDFSLGSALGGFKAKGGPNQLLVINSRQFYLQLFTFNVFKQYSSQTRN